MTFALDRLPPHDTEAEESVVAACLVDPGRIPVVANVLPDGRMFYHERCCHAFDAILRVYVREGAEAVNQVTVAHDLAARDQLELVGGQTWFGEIIRRLTTSSGAEYYAGIVRESARRRSLLTIGSAAQQAAYREDEDVETAADRLVESLTTIGRSPAGNRGMSAVDILDRGGLEAAMYRRMNEPRTLLGMSTGFPSLDFYLSGLQRGLVYVVAAETSVGKSLLAHNLVHHMADQHRFMVVTSEMGARAVGSRLLHLHAGFDGWAVRARGWATPEEHAAMEAAKAWFERLGENLYVLEGRLSVSTIRMEARAYRSRGGLCVLVIDHMDHIRVPFRKNSNRAEDIEEINAELHALAVELDCAVIAVSHMNRNTQADRMGRLKGGSSKEQDADVVMFISPVQFDPTLGVFVPIPTTEALRRRGQDGHQTVEIDVAKNREGVTGPLYMTMSWNLGGRYIDGESGQEALL